MGKMRISGGQISFNKRTVEVCSMAGINLITDEMVRLSSLRSALRTSIGDIEKQRNSDRFMANVGLSLSLVKAICDATLEIAGALGPPQMKALSEGYKETQDFVAFRQAAHSGKDYDAAKYLAKKVVKAGGNTAVKDAVDLKLISTDGLKAAVTGKNVDSSKAIADMAVKISEMSAKYKNADPATTRALGVAKALINAGFASYKVYDEYRDMKLSDANFEKMKQAQLKVIASFDAQIQALNTVLDACAAERGIKKPSTSSIPDLKMPQRSPTIGMPRR